MENTNNGAPCRCTSIIAGSPEHEHDGTGEGESDDDPSDPPPAFGSENPSIWTDARNTNAALQGGANGRRDRPRTTRRPMLQNEGEAENRELMQGIECDGLKYERERDAPGQNCLYVPPGRHENEQYRLGTFAKYPDDVPVKVTDMAAAGFYFTGYKDRVKCFSCGIAVENWMLGDDAMDRRWHKTGCRMGLGQDPTNDPIPAPTFRSIFRMLTGKRDFLQGLPSLALGHKNYAESPRCMRNTAIYAGASGSQLRSDLTDVTTNFRRVNLSDSFPKLVLANIQSQEHENLLKSLNLKSEQDRRKTFQKWPTYPAPYLPGELAKEGFFYVGNLDRTQCFSCSGVLRNWAAQDSVKEQHEKHFPNCRIVQMMSSGNIPLTDDERKDSDEEERLRISALLPSTDALVEPPDPSPEEQRHLAEYFPCNDAVNPHMQRSEKRIETFARGWPREKIRAAPEAIAKAGFFYLGQGDKTKCFYCNGGLQNWDPNDEPWTEHAKWFPGCEFVLRRKGVEFVRRLADAHPNLNRPNIRNPVSFDIPPRENRPSSQRPSRHTSIDIEQVISMGFERARIDRAIQRKLSQGGYANVQDLIADLLEENENGNEAVGGQIVTSEMEQSMHTSEASGPPAIPVQAGLKRAGPGTTEFTLTKKTRTASPTGSLNAEDEELEDNLREMEKTSLCRRCKSSSADVVFIPCGHLAVCSNCAPGVQRCPICNNKMTSSMKVFRA